MALSRFQLLVGLAITLAACSPLPALNVLVPEDGYERHAGLAYGDKTRQKLDVYVPRGAAPAPRPVVVFFYGGGWQSGERGQYKFIAETLTRSGFMVVIPDYRVHPEVKYPEFVRDGAQAIGWVVHEIGRYGGDPARLVLMGHSAGAHIAAMLAYNRQFLDTQTRASLKGLVGLAGPYDFIPDEAVIAEILAVNGTTQPAMPVEYVHGGEPATLLISGDRDARVNPNNTRSLARRLRQFGSQVDERHYPDLNHYNIMLRLSAPFRDEALVATIADFIRTVTK